MVLDAILDDLVHGVIDGLETIDEHGELSRLAIDITGFLGYYHGTWAVLEVMKHVASAPCPWWSLSLGCTQDQSN